MKTEIHIKELDFPKMENWINRGKESFQKDSIASFIYCWIGFNYYFSTFANSRKSAYDSWRDKRYGDKCQLEFLVQHSDFLSVFYKIKNENKNWFEPSIELPINDLLHGNKVPSVAPGEYSLSDLNHLDLFFTIYQIRNNLFHGGKDPVKNRRDRELTSITGEFLINFIMRLIENTDGDLKEKL